MVHLHFESRKLYLYNKLLNKPPLRQAAKSWLEKYQVCGKVKF